MAGESIAIRDILIEKHVIPIFMKEYCSIQNKNSIEILRVSAWFIANLCRGKPYPIFKEVTCFLPILADMVDNLDVEVCCETLWAFVFLTDGKEEQILEFLNLRKLTRICELMLALNIDIAYPAFRIVGNILMFSKYVDVLIQSMCLKGLQFLICQKKKWIRKEVCWGISNLFAAGDEVIQKVLAQSLIFQKLTSVLIDDFLEVKREATFAYFNATTLGSPSQMKFFIKLAIPEIIFQNLFIEDKSLQIITLKTLINFGKYLISSVEPNSTQQSEFTIMIQDAKNECLLERLENSKNQELSANAKKLLKIKNKLLLD